MVIFHSYVKLPEGNGGKTWVKQCQKPPMTGSLNPALIFMVMTGGW